MIAAWTLVAIAFCALGIVGYFALRSHKRRPDVEKAGQALQSLDIEAFRNLVDSAEEDFLREHLSPRKFREVQRQRAWAALLYAWEAGRAASALAQLAQTAQRSSDPEIVASGVQLAENAFRLRLQSLGACLYLLGGVVWPDLDTRSVPPLVDHYDRAAATMRRLGRLSSGAHGLARSRSA